MELGQKIRQARLEAGLSQRQLCGEVITRNMLSLIENGAAKPSVETLRSLASRLEKPLSWFLEEEGALSPNRALMEQAREHFEGERWEAALAALAAFREPDEVYRRERDLLRTLTLQNLARDALARGKHRYARELLEKDVPEGLYLGRELRRRRALLLGKLPGFRASEAVRDLPELEEELLLRAGAALEQGRGERALGLIGAMENPDIPRAQLLLGRAHMALGHYPQAESHLEKAAEDFPEALADLERCCREQGDYKKAYDCACRRRALTPGIVKNR